ncbi:uncharacterized protein LOC108053625 [Drosophila rhopaloa]|uniref:Uncharacterized protein LOC108053625 n=1 Tax=Drosophila rhopaloa TaxID=1041015 RepID=A0A6P4FWF2_DRORH|nr:uncharacterized protein LOC108053625 [Drosophila rhopaloa]
MNHCTMNYSTLNRIFLVAPIFLLFLMDICESKAWWPSKEAKDYSSLDPVVWSRSFAPEHVRKTRYNVISEPMRKHRHRQSSKLWYQKPVYPENFVSAKYYKKFLRRRQKLAAREMYAHWRQ